MTIPEATAAFNKYGQTRGGLLPYPVFAQALMVGRNRLAGRWRRAQGLGFRIQVLEFMV